MFSHQCRCYWWNEGAGKTGKGFRRVVSIDGGSFEGPNIKGIVVAGGYDWQLVRSDGVVEIDARYMLQTDDGDLITVMNTGLRHGPQQVMQRLTKGEEVDPSEYYFRSLPVFETGNPKYAWLMGSVFIAKEYENRRRYSLMFGGCYSSLAT